MIGVIGGTFDPIHFGHLRPALEIAEQFSLDEVRFIPSATPPHRWKPTASSEQRLDMVKLATGKESKFIVDDREYHRDGASYTIDTLKTIRNEIGTEMPLCMIIGFDAFQTFTQWRDWEGILKQTHLIVSSRPGYKPTDAENWATTYLTETIEKLHKQPSGLIIFAKVTQLDISATYIRAQCNNGKSLRYLTTNAVNKYILRNKLYENQ